jgi:hypothetical protein
MQPARAVLGSRAASRTEKRRDSRAPAQTRPQRILSAGATGRVVAHGKPALLSASEDRELLVPAIHNLAMAYAAQGRFREASVELRAALAEVRGTSSPRAPLYLSNLAYLLAELGELAEARRAAEEGLATAQRFSNRPHEATCRQALAQIAAQSGDYDGALSALKQAEEMNAELRMQPVAAALLALRGRIFCGRGEYRRAVAFLSQAIERLALAARTIRGMIGVPRDAGLVRAARAAAARRASCSSRASSRAPTPTRTTSGACASTTGSARPASRSARSAGPTGISSSRSRCASAGIYFLESRPARSPRRCSTRCRAASNQHVSRRRWSRPAGDRGAAARHAETRRPRWRGRWSACCRGRRPRRASARTAAAKPPLLSPRSRTALRHIGSAPHRARRIPRPPPARPRVCSVRRSPARRPSRFRPRRGAPSAHSRC